MNDWISDRISDIQKQGWVGTLNEALYMNYRKFWKLLGRFRKKGEPIYEKDWDLLIVLDACRVDLIQQVEDDYSFLNHPGTSISCGSMSKEWLEANFEQGYSDQIERTAYITGNPFSKILADREFKLLDEVWKYGWDDKTGTIPPRPLTDRTISVMREYNPDYLIVHYMQPHYPFITDPDLHPGIDIEQFNSHPSRDDIWRLLRKGEVNRSRVLSSYEQNLRVVLDEVSLLLDNVDADQVVISSDHGNAIGEFGIYGHPQDVPLDVIRKVPWYETSATDTGQYEPESYFDERAEDSEPNPSDIKQRLQDLGYY